MLGTLFWIGTAVSAAGGLLSGFSNAEKKRKEREQQKAQIQNAIKQGDADLTDYLETLTDSYKKATNALNDSYTQNKTSLGYTQTSRASNAQTSSMLNTKQSQLEYQELAQILASGKQSVGSAVQQTATSGFRNTGSNQNIVEEAQRQATYSATQAQAQVELSTAQRFASASSTYFSQSAQIEAYQQNLTSIERQKEETTNTYNINSRQAQDKWKQQKDLYEQALKSGDYDTDGWDYFMDVLYGTADSIVDIGKGLMTAKS